MGNQTKKKSIVDSLEYQARIPSIVSLTYVRIDEIAFSSPRSEIEIGAEYRAPSEISAVVYGSLDFADISSEVIAARVGLSYWTRDSQLSKCRTNPSVQDTVAVTVNPAFCKMPHSFDISLLVATKACVMSNFVCASMADVFLFLT